MKYLLLIGGLLGFGLVFLGGLMAGRESLPAVIEGSLGCVVGAVLFRWLGNVYQQSVRITVRERETAARARAEAGPAEPGPAEPISSPQS